MTITTVVVKAAPIRPLSKSPLFASYSMLISTNLLRGKRHWGNEPEDSLGI